jgi:hypothetical protein
MKMFTEYLHSSPHGSYWTEAEILVTDGDLCEIRFYDEVLDEWVTRKHVERSDLRTSCVDLSLPIIDQLTAALMAKLNELLPNVPAGMAAAIADDIHGVLHSHR